MSEAILRTALEQMLSEFDADEFSSEGQMAVCYEARQALAALDSRAGDAGEVGIPPHQWHAYTVAMLAEVQKAGGDMLSALRISAEAGLAATPAPSVDAVPAGEVLKWLTDCDNLILAHSTNSDAWQVRRGSVKGELRGEGETPLAALHAAMSLSHGEGLK